MTKAAAFKASQFIKRNREWLWAGGLLALGVAIIILRFVGQLLNPVLFFNSDEIFLSALYRDIVIDGHPFANWHFPPAPSLFPEGLIYLTVATLVKGKIFQAVIGFAIVQICGLTGCVYALARMLFRERAAALTTALLFFTLALTLSAFKQIYDEYDFILIGGIHVGTALSGLALFALSLRLLAQQSRSALEWTGVFLLVALTAASDLLIVPQAVLPVISLVMLAGWRSGRLKIFALPFAAMLSLAVVMGVALAKLIIPHSDNQIGMGWDHVVTLFSDREHFMASLRTISGSEVALLVLCFAGTIALYIARRAGRSRLDPVQLDRILALFVLGFVFTNLGMAFGGSFALRYLFLSFLFLLFLGSVALVCLWGHVIQRLPSRMPGLSPLLVPTLALCALLVSTALALPRPSQWIGSYYPPQTACLDREIGELVRQGGRPLHGIAGYWETKMNLTLSRMDINTAYTLTPYDTTFRPDYFIASETWFHHKSYDFVVVLDGEAAHYYTDLPLFAATYGQPEKTLSCPGAKIHLYLKHPIRFPQFETAGTGYTWPACHLLHPDGMAGPDCSLSGKRGGQTVALSQGPFPVLQAGRYEASLTYSSPAPKDVHLGAWSAFIVHEAKNDTKFAAEFLGTGGARQTLTRQFDIDQIPPDNYLGLDSVFNGADDLTLYSVSLKRIE